MDTKRTTILLDATDRAAIATIRQRYGAASASDAIRLALRILADSATLDIQPAQRPAPHSLRAESPAEPTDGPSEPKA